MKLLVTAVIFSIDGNFLIPVNAGIWGEVLSDAAAVNEATDLQFIFHDWADGQNLEAGSKFVLIFPEKWHEYFLEFDSEGSTNLPSGTCEAEDGFGTNEELSCYVVSSERKIQVVLSEQTQRSSGTFTIHDMQNPHSSGVSPIAIEIYDANDQRIASTEDSDQGSAQFELVTVPGTFGSISLDNSEDEVAAYGQLQVEIDVDHRIEAGGKIQITFPKWADLDESYLSDVEGCTISSDSSLLTVREDSCQIESGDENDKITVSNVFDGDVSAGEQVMFSIAGVRNPPSTKGISNMEIQTQSADGSIIDQKSDCVYKPRAPAEWDPAAVALEPADLTTATTTTLALTVRPENPLPASSELKVIFPPEVRLVNDQQTEEYLQDVTSLDVPLAFAISSSDGYLQDTVIISGAFETASSRRKLYLDFSNILTPYTDKESSPFQFLISEVDEAGERYPIEGNTGGVTIQAVPAKLQDYSFHVDPSERSVFASFDATIEVRFKGVLKAENFIEIVYPEAFALNPDALSSAVGEPSDLVCTVAIGQREYQSHDCSVSEETRTVSIREYLFQDLSALVTGELITCEIKGEPFLNPPTTEPVDSAFAIRIKDDDEYEMAEFNPDEVRDEYEEDFTYSAQVTEVSQFRITSQNAETGQDSAYWVQFDMLETQSIDGGFNMVIQLPEQVSFSDSGELTCSKLVSLDEDPICSQQGSNEILAQIQEPASTRFAGPLTITFSISPLRNPPSTAPTQSFSITLKTEEDEYGNSYDIVQQTSGVTTSVTRGSPFQAVEVEPQSRRNAAETNYQFRITLSNRMPQRALLEITPPDEISLNPDTPYPDCQGLLNLQAEQSCALSGEADSSSSTSGSLGGWDAQGSTITTNLILDAAEYLEAGESFAIDIQGIQNPISFKESSSFTIRLSDGGYIISEQDEGITVTNEEVDTEASFFNFESLDEVRLGADTTFRVQYTPVHPLPSYSFIEVVLPDSIKKSEYQDLGCVGIENVDTATLQCRYEESSHSISLQTGQADSASSPQRITFLVLGFRNPETTAYTTGKITLRTYDEDHWPITEYDHLLTAREGGDGAAEENVDGAGFTDNPETPCASWGLSPAMCLSCASGLVLVETTCLETCPAGLYAEEGPEGPTCADCSSDCRQCAGQADYCTQCKDPNLFLLRDSGECIQSCPDGQYLDFETMKCEQCDSECRTCSGKGQCTGCPDGKYVAAGECVGVCPSNTILSTESATCLPCQAPCKECAESVSECTACFESSLLPFLYEYACVEECPQGYTADDDQICEEEVVVPFIFLGISFLVVVMICCAKSSLGYKVQYKNMLIAIISSISLANWMFLLYLAVKEEMTESAMVLIYVIASSYILNIIFCCLYLNVMREDEYYNRWREERIKSEQILVILALLTSFQLYRIAFQQLSISIKTHKERRLNKVGDLEEIQREKSTKEFKYSDERTVKSVFNLLTIIMISCVIMPIFVADWYSAFYAPEGHQLFWEFVENIVITGFLFVLMVYDVIKKCKKVEFSKIRKVGEEESQTDLDASRNMEKILGSPRAIQTVKEIIWSVLREQQGQNGGRLGQQDGLPQPGQSPNEAKYMDSQELGSSHGQLSRARGDDWDEDAIAQGERRARGRRNLELAALGSRNDQAAAITDRTDQGLDLTSRNLLNQHEEELERQPRGRPKRNRSLDQERPEINSSTDPPLDPLPARTVHLADPARLATQLFEAHSAPGRSPKAGVKPNEGLQTALLHAPTEEIAEAAEESSPEKAPSETLIHPIPEAEESGKSIQDIKVPEDRQGKDPESGIDGVKQETDQPGDPKEGNQEPADTKEASNLAEEIERGSLDKKPAPSEKANSVPPSDDRAGPVETIDQPVTDEPINLDGQDQSVVPNSPAQPVSQGPEVQEKSSPIEEKGKSNQTPASEQAKEESNKKDSEHQSAQPERVSEGAQSSINIHQVDKAGDAEKENMEVEAIQEPVAEEKVPSETREQSLGQENTSLPAPRSGHSGPQSPKSLQAAVQEEAQLVQPPSELAAVSSGGVQAPAEDQIHQAAPEIKFRMSDILGDFDTDPFGNPILDEDADGNQTDNQAKLVNPMGYLIDTMGNVLDKEGKITFNKEMLDEDGDIPKIYKDNNKLEEIQGKLPPDQVDS